MSEHNFQPFPKLARLSREIIVTEKLDGTNACVYIGEDGTFLTGSRTRWITPENDNFGFSMWAHKNRDELMTLGPGRHFGEWWGCGIQSGYDLSERRFSLFNTTRWAASRPSCCHVVPELYRGPMNEDAILKCLRGLQDGGSVAAPGYMSPEGIVIFHTAANVAFKKTIHKDESHKGAN